MSLTAKADILARIQSRKHFKAFYDKAAAFRRLVNGDFSDLVGGVAQVDPAELNPENQAVNKASKEKYGVFVTDMELFRSNELAKGLKIIAQNTFAIAPEVSFQTLSPDVAKLQSEYLRTRYFEEGPVGCSLHEHMLKSKNDALVTGVGCVMATFRPAFHQSGMFLVPCSRHVDILNVWWDRQKAPSESKWVCVEIEERRTWYDELFGKGEVDKILESVVSTDGLVRSVFYFDCYDKTGTYGVFVMNGSENAYETPLILAESPYYRSTQGYKQPSLPVQFLTYYSMSGSAFPDSIIEYAVRHQIDLWECESHIRAAIKRPPMTVYNENAVNKDDRSKIINPKPGQVIRASTEGPLENVLYNAPGGEVSVTTLNVAVKSSNEIQANIGYNPFATGQSPTVDFATQAAAIDSKANQAANWILARNAGFYRSALTMFLEWSAIYDTAPITLDDSGVLYEHGEETDYGPINLYLQPGAPVSISTDSLIFEGSDVRRSKASARLVELAPFAAQFPNLVKKLVEDRLIADGIHDVGEYTMQPPQTDESLALIGGEQTEGTTSPI